VAHLPSGRLLRQRRGITGIGLILQATNKAGRDGAVVARFSESYIGLPIQAGEQFAVLRALEIAFERGYRIEDADFENVYLSPDNSAHWPLGGGVEIPTQLLCIGTGALCNSRWRCQRLLYWR